MSDVKGMDDFATGQRKSPIDRDMRIAADMGARAAALELSQPGVLAGSHKIRHDFRKGILDRYNPANVKDDEWERERIASQRASLECAYYNQPGFMAAIAEGIKAETTTVVVEIPEDSATAEFELLTVMADGMRNQALVA